MQTSPADNKYLANGITTWSKLGWGVSKCWTGFPLERGSEIWNWNVGQERATTWNMGLEHGTRQD